MCELLNVTSSRAEMFLDEVRAYQQVATYPHLLAEIRKQSADTLYLRERAGTGLVVLAVRHGALSHRQQDALGEFCLHNALLAGLYKADAVLGLGLTSDPEFAALAPDTIHAVVATLDGKLLTHFSMKRAASSSAGAVRPYTLSDPNRPLFRVEVESFGPHVFSSLPTLRDVPLDRIWELSSLVRNQLVQSPLGVIAVVEAVATMAQLQAHPAHDIVATLGCASPEARQIPADLGLPVLYAPLATVVANGLPPYWSEEANTPGRFWPFVIGTEDLQANPDHLDRLDAALAQPSSRQARRALIEFCTQRTPIAPRSILPAPGLSALLWTTVSPPPRGHVQDTRQAITSPPMRADHTRDVSA